MGWINAWACFCGVSNGKKHIMSEAWVAGPPVDLSLTENELVAPRVATGRVIIRCES